MKHSMPSSIAHPWCSLVKSHYISRTSPPQHKHSVAIATQIQKQAITVTRTRGRNGGHAMSTKGCEEVLDSMITQWLPSLAPSAARIRAWAPSTTKLGTMWLNPNNSWQHVRIGTGLQGMEQLGQGGPGKPAWLCKLPPPRASHALADCHYGPSIGVFKLYVALKMG